MRILFVGGTKRGYLTLRALVNMGADVAGIICLQQHDHELERYEEPIRILAEEFGIPSLRNEMDERSGLRRVD